MKILIFSSASIIKTNRAYIRRLSEYKNVTVHLCILYRGVLSFADENSKFYNEPYSITLHELKGRHPRIETIYDFKSIVKSFDPTHIFLEFDPASKLVVDVIKTAKKYNNQVKIGCLVVENRNKYFIKDAIYCLKKRSLKLFLGNLLCHYYNNISLKRLNYIFPISKESCHVYFNLGYSKNIIHQIPLGIDRSIFFNKGLDQRVKMRANLNLHSFTIAYFGRLVPEKGIHILIEALSLLEFNDWQLLIDNFETYKTSYSIEIKNLLSKYGLENQIVFFDSKHEDMPQFYNAIDLLVLPSIETENFKEQYGRVLVEAMLTRTFVIGSDTGAIPEILNDKYLVFKSGDSLSLANKISEIRYLLEKQKNELLNKNFDNATVNLSSERQAEILHSVILNS